MALKKKPAHPLKVWRATNSITGKVLSAEMGVSQSYLSEVESGNKRPAFKCLMMIRKATENEVTADEILDWYAENIVTHPTSEAM